MIPSVARYWHDVKYWPKYWRTRRFYDYKPQAVTVGTIKIWLQQFEEKDQKTLIAFLDKVFYLSEKNVEKLLVDLNKSLLARLNESQITPKNIIYVQIHEAGSSSPVILNMIRDRALLERKGCHFIDSKDVRALNELTNKLENGAIIYVDDFVGTGNQFCEVRDFVVPYIVGNFSEFFLLPCICEEALYELGKRGVEAVSGHIHSKSDRPLHPNSSVLPPTIKKRLIELCLKIDQKGGLGYRNLATMVVLYRNAPNSVPLILRGSLKQNPWRGILPRTTDLPY
ncbi:MAG: hypothetical protein ABSH06_24755 [Thermodesulfobacteriota bacterium]|jgi:hypothetical protein